MKTYRNRSRRGFSLVELLAVVLVLAVLAAVAVPLYISQRKSAATRACKANLAAIAAAESAYALRNDRYGTIAELLATAEGLAKEPKCPYTGGSYTLNPTAPTANASLVVSCPAPTNHVNYGASATTELEVTLRAPGSDSLP